MSCILLVPTEVYVYVFATTSAHGSFCFRSQYLDSVLFA